MEQTDVLRPIMTPPNNNLFQPGELRWLIDHERLDVTPLSPLATARYAAPSGDLNAFQQGGFLSEEWRGARALLAQPRRQVRVHTPGVESTKRAVFYANGSGDLVGCWLEGEAWRITFPWTLSALADMTVATVGGGLPIPADPFAVTLQPAGLMLLMAVVDAIREARLSAVLARRGQPPLLFTEADFQRQLANGYACDDANWSVTLLRLISASRGQPDNDAFPAGLNELEAAQLLRRKNDQWEPSDVLWRLAAYWTPSLPAVSHEAVTIDETGAMVGYRHGIVLRGEGPLWIIDYEGLANGNPKASLRSIASEGLHDWLTSLLEAPPLPARERAGVTCSACGAALSADDLFCPKCGTRTTEPAVKLCGNPACGQPLRPGADFCHRCGWRNSPAPQSAPIAVPAPLASEPASTAGKQVSAPVVDSLPPRQSSPAPAAPSSISTPVADKLCSNPKCRKPVPPGKKFCTACGTKVS
jgi:hypothetical protein